MTLLRLPGYAGQAGVGCRVSGLIRQISALVGRTLNFFLPKIYLSLALRPMPCAESHSRRPPICLQPLTSILPNYTLNLTPYTVYPIPFFCRAPNAESRKPKAVSRRAPKVEGQMPISSGIRHPVSGNWYLVSGIRHPVPVIEYPATSNQ